jgi:uncharacterized membrane protein HdeD (DUF308 family)
VEPATAYPYPPGNGPERLARLWPVPLVLGILEIILGFVVLSYSTTSLGVVSILVGISFCYTGLSWIVLAFVLPEYRWVHAIGGALAVSAGIVAFVYPGETLRVLSLVVGWAMLIAGIAGIVLALANRHRPQWWIGLIGGLLNLGLGGWAVRETDRSVILLLTIVGVYCVVGGISAIAQAFQLRKVDESHIS